MDLFKEILFDPFGSSFYDCISELIHILWYQEYGYSFGTVELNQWERKRLKSTNATKKKVR